MKEVVHVCSDINATNRAQGFGISVEKFQPEPDALESWYLCYTSFATDDEVRAGEAAESGEVMAEVSLLINYCPLCGELLP